MPWQRLAIRLVRGAVATLLVVGCSTGTTASPTPSLPPALLGLWTGNVIYEPATMLVPTNVSVVPCSSAGECGHWDNQEGKAYGGGVWGGSLVYQRTDGDTHVFWGSFAYDNTLGSKKPGEHPSKCELHLTPQPDGTLAWLEVAGVFGCPGSHGTLVPVWSLPAPSGGW